MPDNKPVAIAMEPDYTKIKDDLRRRAQAESEARFKGSMFEGMADTTSATPAEKAARASTELAPQLNVLGMGGPMAGMLSRNPAVRGATATSKIATQVADAFGLGDEYKSLLSDLESRGIISINPEYAKQAGVSTKYTRYQDSKK